MQAWVKDRDVLERALGRANESYSGNLCWKREPERVGRAFAFTLRVVDSGKEGARRSRTGRRIASACWHAHRDFMSALFEANPDARLKTAMADYRGRGSFYAQFVMTGEQNIGSVYQPMCLADACECEQEER